MANNKVVFGGRTLIDLTSDTVTPQTLANGVTAHNKSGNKITGTLKPIFAEYDGLSENLIPSAIDTDGSIYNGTGYKLGYRLNSSGGESAQANEFLSGYIPYSENDVFVLKATTTSGVNIVRYAIAYDKDFKMLFILTGAGHPLEVMITPGVGVLNKPTQVTVSNQSKIPSIKYLRFSIQEYPSFPCTIHKAI